VQARCYENIAANKFKLDFPEDVLKKETWWAKNNEKEYSECS